MPLLLVVYDSKKPIKSQSDLLNQIDSYSNARLSESAYTIITDKEPKIVGAELKRLIDKNDNLYVITLKLPYDGCGPGQANEWLKKGLTY